MTGTYHSDLSLSQVVLNLELAIIVHNVVYPRSLLNLCMMPINLHSKHAFVIPILENAGLPHN